MGKLKLLRGTLSRLKPVVGFLNDDKAAASRARDRRVEWRGWYKLARWQAKPDGLRWRVLVRDLFTCQRCGWLGSHQTWLLVADHRRPHRGDPVLFWDEGNVWCLCKTCHDGAKQSEERAAARGGGVESLPTPALRDRRG